MSLFAKNQIKPGEVKTNMEKIEEVSRIFYDGDISYQDLLDFGSRDEFKPRYDESTGYQCRPKERISADIQYRSQKKP